MESKVRALELEVALDSERARLAALRKRHYHLAHAEEYDTTYTREKVLFIKQLLEKENRFKPSYIL
ncbi:unnamed protein product [Leptidea sinapis]|uniref:I/LWEQ domain-containing protein n=1 Tax=Leptidea sinapis TaxID=189913 RepID=A0A5E4QJR5_9NEOP|nr:unnamed protein product [Leptidea sinapis]